MEYLIVGIASYLMGSIPFGLILTKIFLKKDIREIGSGNIGTTNVLRTGKKSLAAATLVLDLLKGYFSIIITFTYFENLISYSALICFIGHIFPVWLKFRGGKGVATYLGVVLALSFKFFLVLFASALFIDSLSFPAIMIRKAHERPECMDEGTLIMSGLKSERIIESIEVVTKQHKIKAPQIIKDYDVDNVSIKVTRIILSYIDYINRTVWKKGEATRTFR